MTARPTTARARPAARFAYWATWRIRHSRVAQTSLAVIGAGSLATLKWGTDTGRWVFVALACLPVAYLGMFRRDAATRWVRTLPTSWAIRSRWGLVTAKPENQIGTFNPYGLRRWLLGPERTARIRHITRHDGAVVVHVEMLRGQGPQVWRQAAGNVGAQLGMLPPLVETSGPRTIRLTFPADARIASWTTAPAAAVPDFRAVPLARTAGRKAWKAPILGSHMLIAGATGSGKGSVLWSIVGQLAPAVKEGSVQLWGVDPKGGIELGYGETMFSRFVYGSDSEAVAELLEDAAKVMADRLETLRGNVRLHAPDRHSPLIVVVIDEFLALTALVGDKAIENRIQTALGLLLSQGRAPGVTVVAATQDVSKESLKARTRDLIPLRVCLRVADADQVDMCLGRGARGKGALADGIDPDAQGTAYVYNDDGGRVPVLVRFPWWPDDAIRSMAAKYPTPVRQPSAKLEQDLEQERPAPEAKPKPSLVRDAIEQAIQDDPDLTAPELAQTVGCTVRYARRILAEHTLGAA